MAAPMAQLRKHLSAPGLLRAIRQTFKQIPDHRRGPLIPLADALMSGLAVFGLKYPSLLKFDEAYGDEATLRHNLRTLYGVEHAPCDTQLRTIAVCYRQPSLTLHPISRRTRGPCHQL